MLELWEQRTMPHPYIYLRSWRETRALTQKELADLIGMQVVTISRIENDRFRAGPSTRRKLAEALGISPADLLGPPAHAQAKEPEA